MQSPPARAGADYFCEDHQPLAIQGKARLRGTRTPTVTLSTLAIGYRLSALWGKARLRGTRTPTVTLLAIGYRLSALAYWLLPIGYRLSPIGSGESKNTLTVDSTHGHHLNRFLRVAHGLHLFQAHPQVAQRHRRF